MTQQEEYVRARWQFVGVWVRDLDSYGTDQFNVVLCFPQEDADYNQEYFMRWQEDNDPKSRAAVWQAAYDFTVAREEEIRLLEEEIDSAESDVRWFEKGDQIEDRKQEVIHQRTLARLQQALEDLTKGMVKA